MKKYQIIGKKVVTVIGTVLAVVLAALTTLLCFSIEWMFQTWANLTMDEMVYHLTAPLEGTNEGMIQEYCNVCVVPAVFVLFIVVILFIVWRKDKRKYYSLIGILIVGSIVISIGAVRGAWKKLDVGNFVKGQSTYSTFIDTNYVDPADVELTFPEKKRNLIYIFLESMETTYADKENGGAFEENVIPELTVLAQENEDFSGETSELNGGYAMTGATWTMGALFAHTSGLPLSISIEENSMGTQDSFFAGAITLGDILQQAGYSQTFMIGSDAVFGGRKLYFEGHGNYDIIDYNYAVEHEMIPEDYRVWWGYEDEKLFSFAQEKLLELAEQDAPFNFTILTVDTHFEDGYPCELCPDTFGKNQYANVMACASKQVDDFVKWVQQQAFYENTSIVIVGDHPTMDKDFCDDVDNDYTRRVYTSYINADASIETSARRDYTTFDDFPTTLASLGVKINGNRLGLGTNLFSSTPTLTERFGIKMEERELKKKSKLMKELGNIDESKIPKKEEAPKVPAATVEVGAYESETAGLPVRVSNIQNVQGELQSVKIAVWKSQDQSDIQWIELGADGDGSYVTKINIANFDFNTGEYNIHVYAIDEAGEQIVLGRQIGVVE